MYIAKLKKDCVCGYYTDKYGIMHYAPNWDLSLLKHVYSKHKIISNMIGFNDFCSIIDAVTEKYYFVFMCCYPKLSDTELLDKVIHETYEELKLTT